MVLLIGLFPINQYKIVLELDNTVFAILIIGVIHYQQQRPPTFFGAGGSFKNKRAFLAGITSNTSPAFRFVLCKI